MPYIGLGQAVAGVTGLLGQQQQQNSAAQQQQLYYYQNLYNTYTTASTATSGFAIPVAPVEEPKRKQKRDSLEYKESHLEWLDRRVTEMRVTL